MPKTIEVYKAIRQTFVTESISHYTYQLKCERAYRTVLRGLHPSEDTANVTMELEKMGHEVRQIVKVLHRATKEALPLFYVDLEPKNNNKDIFKIKQIDHMKITFEPPHKKKEVLQCKRCQRFGHSKNQCFRPFRCVKCGDDHPTTTCAKSRDTEATCANCQEKHPASYRGCLKYKQYKEQILKLNPKPRENQAARRDEDHMFQRKPEGNLPSRWPGKPKKVRQNVETAPTCWTDNDPLLLDMGWKTAGKASHISDKCDPSPKRLVRSFADAAKAKTTEDHKPQTASTLGTENLVEIIDKMFNKLQLIMTNMMDRMMDRMIQLISSMLTSK